MGFLHYRIWAGKWVLKASSLRICHNNQWVIGIDQQSYQSPVDPLLSFCATGQQRSYLIILTYTLNTKSRAAIIILWGSRCLCSICSRWVTGADQSTWSRCEVLGVWGTGCISGNHDECDPSSRDTKRQQVLGTSPHTDWLVSTVGEISLCQHSVPCANTGPLTLLFFSTQH